MSEFERTMLGYWILQTKSNNRKHAQHARQMILEINRSASWQGQKYVVFIISLQQLIKL